MAITVALTVDQTAVRDGQPALFQLAIANSSTEETLGEIALFCEDRNAPAVFSIFPYGKVATASSTVYVYGSGVFRVNRPPDDASTQFTTFPVYALVAVDDGATVTNVTSNTIDMAVCPAQTPAPDPIPLPQGVGQLNFTSQWNSGIGLVLGLF